MFKLTPYNRNEIMRRRNNGLGLNDLFGDVLNDVFLNDGFFAPSPLENGSFSVDIKELDDAFVLEAELPGIEKDAVTVEYKNGHLSIKATKNESKDDEKGSYIYKERSYSSLQRVFRLDDIKGSAVSAKLENGILTVTAPKLDEVVNNYKIEIK